MTYDAFCRKIVVTWTEIAEAQDAKLLFQHIVTDKNYVVAYTIISVVQSAFDEEYKDQGSLQRRKEFDLVPGVMVEASLINPETFRSMDDPVTFTCTDIQKEMAIDIYKGTFFLPVVSDKQTPNMKRFARVTTINGNSRSGLTRNPLTPDFAFSSGGPF